MAQLNSSQSLNQMPLVPGVMWGRFVTCGGLVIRPAPIRAALLASLSVRFGYDGGQYSRPAKRVTNPPQVTNLPHNHAALGCQEASHA